MNRPTQQEIGLAPLLRRPLVVIALGVVIGPWLAGWIPAPLAVTGACLSTAISLHLHRGRATLRWIVLTVAACCVGALLPAEPPSTPAGHLVSNLPTAAVAFRARIESRPRPGRDGWWVDCTFDIPGRGRGRLHGKGPLPTFGEGHEVRGVARFRKPRQSRNPGFPQGRWTHDPHRAVYASLVRGIPLLIVAEESSNPPWQTRLISAVRHALPPDAAAVTLAMTLGETALLSPDTRQLFADTGTAHLLAISGLHIGLIAMAVFWILRAVLDAMGLTGDTGGGVVVASITASLICLAYLDAVIPRDPTVRATTMVCVALVGSALRRGADGATCLAVAAILLACIDPFCARRPGFQLSFVAVSALIWAGATLRHNDSLMLFIERKRSRFQRAMKGLFWASIITWLATAPTIAGWYGSVVWGAPLINLVAVPYATLIALPATLVLLSLSILFPSTLPWAMTAVGGLNSGLLRLLEILNPFSFSQSITPPSAVACVLLTASGAALLYASRSRRMGLFAALVAAGLAVTVEGASRWGEDSLHITFLDVGHGDSTLIQTPNGEAILVDGGGRPGGDGAVGRRVVLPALRAAGIGELHAIALTHPDADHLVGLLAVARHMHVRALWWNGEVAESPQQIALLATLAMRKTRLDALHGTGSHLALGEVLFDVLHPIDSRGAIRFDPQRSANDNSLVLRVTLGRTSFLLPGDVEAAGERVLVESMRLGRTTVLKAPHHGSRTSSSSAFLDAVGPAHAVISCGQNNRYNLPAQEVVERFNRRGVRIHRTDREGALEFWTNGEKLFVRRMPLF